MIHPPTLPVVLEAMDNLGYAIFEKPEVYDLNLIGIRSRDARTERFDDWICAAYVVGDRWCWFPMPATTDPGTYWRVNPMNQKGTAILQEGQHRAAFKRGLHRGYPALVQARELPVYRDADRDGVLDVAGVDVDVGWHGLNVHRASVNGISTSVGRWSAGCQVIQDGLHFDFLMKLTTEATRRWPTLTYTLLLEEQLVGAE